MDTLFPIIFFLAGLAAIGLAVAALFAKGKRGKMLKLAALALVVSFGSAMMGPGLDPSEKLARDAERAAEKQREQAQAAAKSEEKQRAQADATAKAEEKARQESAAKEAKAQQAAELAKMEAAKREEERLAKLKENELADAKCRSDLQCWGDRNMIKATPPCRRVVEKLAQYDFQWTNSTLEPKFSHFRWKQKEQGVVTFIGDKIKLQNGFGAWQHYTYECDFDTQRELVVDVRGRPGRLP